MAKKITPGMYRLKDDRRIHVIDVVGKTIHAELPSGLPVEMSLSDFTGAKPYEGAATHKAPKT